MTSTNAFENKAYFGAFNPFLRHMFDVCIFFSSQPINLMKIAIVVKSSLFNYRGVRGVNKKRCLYICIIGLTFIQERNELNLSLVKKKKEHAFDPFFNNKSFRNRCK